MGIGLGIAKGWLLVYHRAGGVYSVWTGLLIGIGGHFDTEVYL